MGGGGGGGGVEEEGESELARAFGVIFGTARKFRVMTILQVWFPVLRRFVSVVVFFFFFLLVRFSTILCWCCYMKKEREVLTGTHNIGRYIL